MSVFSCFLVYSSYVRIRDVALKTCWRRWTIGRSGESGSVISVLVAQHDDNDIYIYIYISGWQYIYIYVGGTFLCEHILMNVRHCYVNNWTLSFHWFNDIIQILFPRRETLKSVCLKTIKLISYACSWPSSQNSWNHLDFKEKTMEISHFLLILIYVLW